MRTQRFCRQTNTRCGGGVTSILCRYRGLNRDRALDGIDCAGEIGDAAVASIASRATVARAFKR